LGLKHALLVPRILLGKFTDNNNNNNNNNNNINSALAQQPYVN
jgi:hypothetical protein